MSLYGFCSMSFACGASNGSTERHWMDRRVMVTALSDAGNRMRTQLTVSLGEPSLRESSDVRIDCKAGVLELESSGRAMKIKAPFRVKTSPEGHKMLSGEYHPCHS